MNKAIFWIVGIAALVVIFFAFNQYIYQEKQADVDATYFQQKLVARGVADIGQPIEGFDANLLMIAFPGLLPRDFDTVQTLEGHYELQEDNTLAFVRDQSQPISSAERMISDVGFSTLLQNVAFRLEITPDNDEAVDTIIDTVDTSEHITVTLDETGSVLDVMITPLEVLEDSRCPVDVECIQAGTVRLKATLVSGLGEAEQEFELGTPITTEAEEVTLVVVLPPAHSETEITSDDYEFRFRVAKR